MCCLHPIPCSKKRRLGSRRPSPPLKCRKPLQASETSPTRQTLQPIKLPLFWGVVGRGAGVSLWRGLACVEAFCPAD
ncbi:hypothetical protein QJS10_CPA03g01340 [Acorus calamus]|uniref:Uncharacterized protein n=1 Tax=Acorus calamus TaxID=4465 RepID=A0AAV9FAA2_ACOCL|nr:hypothetical protein QJS10_CPA03g01340 [Acorus calamus]